MVIESLPDPESEAQEAAKAQREDAAHEVEAVKDRRQKLVKLFDACLGVVLLPTRKGTRGREVKVCQAFMALSRRTVSVSPPMILEMRP